MATVVLLSAKPPTVILPPKPTTSTTIFSIRNPRNHHHNHRFCSTVALSSSFRNGRTPSEIECPVPIDQQPVNEYQSLRESFPFSWGSGDLVEYFSRLIATGASFALFVGLPVARFGVANPESEPFKCFLGAISSGTFVVTLAVLRMYLGWAYVGNRLLSATVEYEETGWYDGQIWVKTAEVLARDRLLGSFLVKPVLSRLKYTLVGLAASLLICVLLLINIEGTRKVSYIPE